MSEELIKEVIASKVQISLTYNNQEWIPVPSFKYHDISISRVAYVTNFAEEIESEEERNKLWLSEEPVARPPSGAGEEELKKLEEEKAKKIAEENQEVQTVAKRSGTKLYVYGENFIKNADNSKLRFTLGEKTVDVAPIFKNSKKLA